ncbi:TetR/AcrR family transcriptional regulator [Desulfobulbus alkaliphilus]|uniref:TetR/AcrR family transcriptional regulator n=1 Tax=Desulfobulbus alkaliphilus TaxID=869814 RepID=UPI001F05D647|nr:TetR/AcrR family transcriptional regulator [Desulfobulbus alkaliphilus]
MGRRKAGGASRKEAILEMATVFFAEKGFRDTAIGDIARMIGVADGTIFYHYKTKEDLFVAVMENFKEQLIRETREYLAGRGEVNGLERIEGLISFYISLAAKLEQRFLLLHRHYPYELAEDNPGCRRHLEDIYDFFTRVFEDAILAGQRDDSIIEIPAHKVALILFTMVDGLVRIGTFRLYQPSALYEELTASCRRMLEKKEGA